MGHTKECILLICAMERGIYQMHLCGLCRVEEARCRESLILAIADAEKSASQNEHCNKDEGNETILDQLEE